MLDAGFLSRAQRLRFVVRRIRAGQTQGERRSTKRGASVEFADYRDYTRGDDLRRVDWNIYARLERPFVKLFEEEEDLAVHVLLDGSGSMDWSGDAETRGHGDTETRRHGDTETRGHGDTETRGHGDTETRRHRGTGTQGKGIDKWEYARQVAAALGYIALCSGDRLSITLLQRPTSNLQPPTSNLQPPTSNLQLRGRNQTLRLFEWLTGLRAGGVTDLDASLRAYALAGGRAGLAVLISDLFSPAGYTDGLSALAARGHEVVVLHLLSPDEVEPPLTGDLRLIDVETGDPQEVTLDGGMRALYRRRLEAWREEIRAACRSRGVRYLPLTTDVPIERAVLYEMRRSGVVH